MKRTIIRLSAVLATVVTAVSFIRETTSGHIPINHSHDHSICWDMHRKGHSANRPEEIS